MSVFCTINILTPVQHGFRSKLSCETQLLLTADEFMQNFEGKTQTYVVVLDFSKAFAVVPHQCLLHNLDHYGIRRTTLNWIQHFMINTTQKSSSRWQLFRISACEVRCTPGTVL